jgi:hypothetical protein
VIVLQMRRVVKCILWMTAAAFGVGQGCLIYYLLFAGGGPPVLQVDTAELDFGAIPFGVKVKRVFHLTNIGGSPLIIRRIQTGCGCLEVNLTRNNIAPATSEALQVTMTVESLRNKQVTIFVFSNDPRQPALKLSVKADAVMKSIVEPQVVDFGQVESTATLPITKSFRLSLKQDYFAGLESGHLSFTVNEPYLRVDDSQPCRGNMKEIRISLQKDAPLGDVFTQLLISDATKSASIRILGYVRGKYMGLPQMIVLGPIGPHDDVISEQIAVKCRGDGSGGPKSGVSKPNIASVELSETLAGLLSVTKVRDGENAGITVTLDTAQYSGLWSSREIYGHIRMKCSSNGEESEELNVPVLVVLRLPKIRDE